MKIVFMGTPDFAKTSLDAIVKEKHEIVAVVTNPDKPQGRGMKLTPSPVKQYAIENGLPVLQPEKIRKNENFIDMIKQQQPDVICVVAYGKILPAELLKIPKFGCVNVHGSLLPKYRGAAPIQWAVINGDSITGITTMYMDEGMDSGDMILKEEVAIGDNETTGELWNRLSIIGANLLVKTLKLIEQGKEPREKQGKNYTLAPMLEKSMGNINWEQKTAKEIKNLVRGLNPIMGAYSFLNGKKIKFWKADVIPENTFMDMYEEFAEYAYKIKEIDPGTILFVDEKKGLYVKTKDGILSVLEIQSENSKKMKIDEFLRGNKIQAADGFKMQ